MLEKIKLLLEITDNSQDEKINYYISSVTQKVLNYINQETLPTQLNYVVEEIVINRLEGKASNIKQINRGDVTISYETTNELQPYEKELSTFKTVRIV